ncbi:MAG TPA: hypothetical protein ENJ78_00420 [candidate division WWE3 bacterium]|uniref:Uncharacterized protein n=1 Tax=candidate division WWE3 bacterium TaxID=2053526 RepID=A0A7V5J175_UNCKA|nr:hypothetical protein [candidate division WWE3 bacterium]
MAKWEDPKTLEGRLKWMEKKANSKILNENDLLSIYILNNFIHDYLKETLEKVQKGELKAIELKNKIKKTNSVNLKIAKLSYNKAIEYGKKKKYSKEYKIYDAPKSYYYEYNSSKKGYLQLTRKNILISNAVYNKAIMLSKGLGVKRNLSKAVDTFELIFSKGMHYVINENKELKAKSAFNIALLYCKYPISIIHMKTSIFYDPEISKLESLGMSQCSKFAKKALDLGYNKEKINKFLKLYDLESL